MSITRLNETDIYEETAELADDTLSMLEEALMDATGTSSLVDAVIKKLDLAIQRLETEEQKILEAFGINGITDFALAEAALQEKFRNFYGSTGLINLSGPQIEEAFLREYRISVDENMREMQEYIDKYVIPNMMQFLDTTGTQDMGEALRKALNASLKDIRINLDLTQGVTKVVTTRSSAGIIKEGDIIKVLADDFTKKQTEIVNGMRDFAKKHGEPALRAKLGISNNTITSSITSEWYDLTRMGTSHALTETQIKKMIQNHSITEAQLENVNKQLTNLIKSQTNRPDLVEKYINKMLRKDNDSKYMFFVGKNANAITGILGEIAAVIAVSSLLKNVDADKVVDWVANKKINNTKKLSIDILLKDIGNIQVKNTTKDLTQIPQINVDFAKGNVDYILNKLEQGYNLNTDILRSVLESESFNVPAKYYNPSPYYHKTSTDTSFKRKPKDWDQFVKAYNLMTKVISRTHIFLTTFAPDFLYMVSPANFENQLAALDYSMDGFIGQGVHLYIVGGIPYLASEQLKIIQEDLRNLNIVKDAEQHFTIKTIFGTITRDGEKIPYDYVAYKNKIGAKQAKLTSAYAFTT